MSALVRIASRAGSPLRKRDLLMLSCAAAALGVVAPEKARAQGFQGTETVVSGIADRTITGETSDLITIGSRHATIDWSPYDNQGTGTIDFLPAGHSATFTNNPELTGNYVVLNRIVPADASRPIALNGTIVSQIQDSAQNASRGGSVWFYSPGGIMVGSTAVIDVGGLMLTTNDVTSFGSTPDFNGVNATFAGSSESNAAVHIQSGAQISALANNSYVAVVAPRVIQDGTVRADGSVAYVAAQAATLSVNQGLFDIQVDVGTGDGQGITHTGTTGGPSSTGAGDNHGIYMVAVPKNQVLATFLTGNVGFDAASSASVENGIIVLSAGYNVNSSAGQTGDLLFSGGGDDGGDPLGTGTASFHIDTGRYSSDVVGRAGHNIFSSGLNGSTIYDGDVTLIGRTAAHINARNGHDITIAGNATVTNGMSSSYRDRSSQGGQALLNVEAGSILTIGGNATIDAAVLAQQGQAATGGEAGIYSNGGGVITIGGAASLDSSAIAGSGIGSQGGGLAQGGTTNFGGTGGGSISVTGGVTALAQAVGGTSESGAAGAATGGQASLFNDASTISIDGGFSANAGAIGGTSISGGAGGSGTGGSAGVGANNGTNDIGGGILASATGVGGAGASGGNGTGGEAWVHASGTAEISASSLILSADGSGGAASGSGAAGIGTGGEARLQSNGGAVDVSGVALVHAVGRGGSGTAGGSGQGGTALAFASGGDLTVGGALQLSADGVGGNATAGSGGDGIGGFSQIYVQDAALTFESASVATLGIGGNGAVGGDGFGGYPTTVTDDTAPDGGAYLSVRNGTATGSSLLVMANAVGGNGSSGVGGNAVGGAASVTALNGTGTGLIDLANVSVESNGTGGAGGAGATGGIGEGGESYLLARAVNGALSADNVILRSTGTGGAGGANADGTGGAGGAGWGGFAIFGTTSGTVTSEQREGYANFGSVDADVSAIGGVGGSGSIGGAGGTGIGGSGYLVARGSAVTAATVNITADGTGGLGGLGGSSRAAGGLGVGGDAGVSATNIVNGTTPATVDVGSLTATASGLAVDSSATTQSGSVTIQATNSSVELGSVEMTAAGVDPRDVTITNLRGQPITLTAVPSGLTAENATIRVLADAEITASGPIDILATGMGSIEVSDDLSLVSLDDIGVLAADGGEITVGSVLRADTLGAANGGSIGIRTTTQTGSGRATGILVSGLGVDASEDAEVLGVSVVGTANIVYGGDVELGDLSADLLQVRLGPPLANQAGVHTAEISGLVSARSMTLESGDLIIESGGQLGEAGVTDSLELIARSFGDPILVGGEDLSSGETGQYVLSQADAERIEASAITFRATSNSPQQAPQVIVRDLTIQGSAGEGTSSVLLTTAGRVRVEGDLAYIDAAADDALRIVAGERLEVITPDGSIRMVGPDGSLSGMLTLQSPNVVVANAALAAQLAENPNFSGRDAALATNNGPVNEAGYLQSGGMQLLTSGNIFIQNSGTATQFAGLTVGGQGLLVGRYQASTNPDGTQTFSFTGTLTTADDVLYFDFTITAESEIVLRSYSYAGGTNGSGQQIPAGGFDPILSLFNAAGDLIDSNDDGDNVPTDPTTGNAYDVFLESLLPAGTYRVAVTAYSNFPVGDNLSEGWQGGGDFDGRTANFAFDVSGADNVTQPGDDNPITVIGFGRMQNADGSFTSGADFFQQVDFGIDNGVTYTEGSTFNGFAIGEEIPVPPPPPPPTPTAPSGVTGSDAVLGGIGVVGSGSGSDAEPEDSDDGSGVSVNTSTGLINTGTGGTEELLDEAVTSGGDTSQWIDDECLPEDDQLQCKEGNN